MENILYLDDYINFYNKKNNLLIIHRPYKDTLKHGKIIDHDKFVKKFNKIILEHKLNQNFFTSSITVIINGTYTKEDKIIIKEVLESLNYKNINFIYELRFFKMNKNRVLINANKEYVLIYYLDYRGNTQIITIDNNKFLENMLNVIFRELYKKKFYVLGKFYPRVTEILEKIKANYYYFEDGENFIIQKSLIEKTCKVQKNT